MKPFIPHPYRLPNKFLCYKFEQFDDGVGHTALLKKAIYLDKNKNRHEETVPVIWDKTIL